MSSLMGTLVLYIIFIDFCLLVILRFHLGSPLQFLLLWTIVGNCTMSCLIAGTQVELTFLFPNKRMAFESDILMYLPASSFSSYKPSYIQMPEHVPKT